MRLVASGRFDEAVLGRLSKDWDVVTIPHRPNLWGMPERELIDALHGVDVLLTEVDPITASVLASCPDLKAVVSCHGNPVNVDVPAATAEGVMVVNTPGRNAYAVAELCVALMVMVARNVVAASDALRSGQWANAPRGWAYRTFQGCELAERTVGLVGLGAVGRLVAKRLKAFDMTVLAYDPYVSQEVADTVGARLVPLDTLLTESDFVSMHVHVTDGTRGMIAARQFALMKPTAFFINTGRAGAMDEEAMLHALSSQSIAGAGLDVYHREPLPTDSPLLKMPNVTLLPHICGATSDVIRHHSLIAEMGLADLRGGQVPRHLFNNAVLENARLRAKVVRKS